jgi:hypothetical protein
LVLFTAAQWADFMTRENKTEDTHDNVQRN